MRRSARRFGRVTVASLVLSGALALAPVVDIGPAAAAANASISGHVTGAGGAAVSGLAVHLYPIDCVGGVGIDTTTDASGNYAFSGNVPPGSYGLSFSALGPYPSQHYPNSALSEPLTASNILTVTAGQNRTNVNDQLVVGGTIKGTVTAGGVGVDDAYVVVAPVDANANQIGPQQYAYADANGAYSLPSAVPGKNVVYFASVLGNGYQWYHGKVGPSGSATPVTVTSGGTNAGIDAALTPGGSISGTVTGPGGTPLSGITAVASSSSAAGGFPTSSSANTNASGAFTITGLPTDGYKVEFQDHSGPPATYATTSVSATVTAPNATSGINKQLVIGGKVTGKVTDISAGTPLSGVIVEAFPANSDTNHPLNFGRTAADGTYSVGGLPTGSVHLSYTGFSGHSQYYKNTTAAASATSVSVTAGATTTGINDSFAGSCTVAPRASTTALTSSVNPSASGQSVTFTATITPASGGAIPSGTVTFKDGTTTLGTGAVNDLGKATFTTSALTGGTHSITAVYGGDAGNLTSTSSALSQSVTGSTATATALAADHNPSVAGQAVTYTATVSRVSGTGTPTGTVTFTDEGATAGPSCTGTTLGSVALTSGVAHLSTSTLSAGTHQVCASYHGDATYALSTSAVIAQVVRQPTATLLSEPYATPYQTTDPGHGVTFTATVSRTNAAGTPTGQVAFKDGTTTIGTGTLDGSGRATFATSSLTSGLHQLTATYAGASADAPSTSAPLNHIVTGTPVGGGTVSGKITAGSASGPAIAGSVVVLCPELGCPAATSDAGGTYTLAGVPSGSFTLQANPPPSGTYAGYYPARLGPLATTGTGAATGKDIVLKPPRLPVASGGGGATVWSPSFGPQTGAPRFYANDVSTITQKGCTGGTAVLRIDSQIGGGLTIFMDEESPGVYVGHLDPAQIYGKHEGPTTFDITITCGGGGTQESGFDGYIDPSGTVVDGGGHPIAGATVTLLQAATAAGPFTAVPNGSAVMSPGNRVNPTVTSASGHYGWDVIAGYYKVQAAKSGCTTATSGVLQIPPAVTDLNVVMTCSKPYYPLTSWATFVTRQFKDLTAAAPSSASLSSWVTNLSSGAKTKGDLADALRRGSENLAHVDPIVRLYRSFLGRAPDAGGLKFWINRRRAVAPARTWSATQIAESFTHSDEFVRKYGSMSNKAFVTQIYTDVLGRAADPSGVTFWTKQLDTKKKDRAQVVIGFSESTEYQRKQAQNTDVTVACVYLLGRAPTATEASTWVTSELNGKTDSALLTQLLNSTTYATHVG